MKPRRSKPQKKSESRSAKWHRANSGKAGSSPTPKRSKPAKVRQGLIPGSVEEHDEKIIRAAEDWRQASGALEDARRELREAESHLIGLIRKKGKTSWRDADGTLVTVRESKPKPTVNVEKVIPTRTAVAPTPEAPKSSTAPASTTNVDDSPYCACGHSHGAHESRNGADHRCLAPECNCAQYKAKVEAAEVGK